MTEFRRELLEKAKVFYVDFLKQDASSEALRHEMALAHLRVGHINRWLIRADEAAREYEQAISLFQSLENESDKPEYRQGRAGAYNWLGLTLAEVPGRAADAEKAYSSALTLQEDLLRANSSSAAYQQETARTRYNRGMLHFDTLNPGTAEFVAAEADFREAIRLLEPLASGSDPVSTLELARAYNNLANLVALDEKRFTEARGLYESAIRRDEELTKADPANRVYKLELAKFCNNFAYLLRELGEDDLAHARSRQAIDLLAELALPAPSLGIEQADAYNVRGLLLQRTAPGDALTQYGEALQIYESRWRDSTAHYLTPAHTRFQDLLLNLASFGRDSRDSAVHALLLRAISGYLDMAQASLKSGSTTDAELVRANVANLLPELPERDLPPVIKALRTLEGNLAARK
jgi:tetratricopeptide (TPR) repeat protein